MTNTPIIRQIPADLVHQFLPLCRQYIEAALVYTDLSFDQACEIARNHGATRVHVLARQSAARLYKRLGLVEKSVLMEKNLCQDL